MCIILKTTIRRAERVMTPWKCCINSLSFCFSKLELGQSERERKKVLLYHLLLSITLFLSVCRSKASENGVPKMYIVEMTGRQCGEKAWSIRHVSQQKGEGGEAEKGLGVDLIPQLEEFGAFSRGQVSSSSAFFRQTAVIRAQGETFDKYLLTYVLENSDIVAVIFFFLRKN